MANMHGIDHRLISNKDVEHSEPTRKQGMRKKREETYTEADKIAKKSKRRPASKGFDAERSKKRSRQ